MHIRNPVEWGWAQLRQAGQVVGTGHVDGAAHERLTAPLPVRRINAGDLKDVLAKGLQDFAACRTDAMFLCVIYPVMGLVLARLVSGYELLPLLFPLASGFALIGPFAAIGLYEMSRRRELGEEISWAAAFGVLGSRSIGAILALGLLLAAIFLLWIGTAWAIYALTLGPEAPTSVTSFLGAVLATPAGWAMIVLGIGMGFLFACLSFAISVVSFPLMVDRDATLGAAIGTSLRAVRANPGPMALWGLIVATGLVLGSIPVLLGLVVVLPVLGHATWHLYRKLVP
jgi:uncharacterized membrane protein